MLFVIATLILLLFKSCLILSSSGKLITIGSIPSRGKTLTERPKGGRNTYLFLYPLPNRPMGDGIPNTVCGIPNPI